MDYESDVFELFDKYYSEEFRHNKRMEDRLNKINKIRSKL